MVPKDLIVYFTTSAQIAGSLIGLLFVSISLRYDEILGRSAQFHSRAMAGAAFTGLFNVLTISLWALVPGRGLGYPVVVSGVVCLFHTLRLHMGKLLAIESALGTFLLSLAVYFAQVVEGIWLIARPDRTRSCSFSPTRCSGRRLYRSDGPGRSCNPVTLVTTSRSRPLRSFSRPSPRS